MLKKIVAIGGGENKRVKNGIKLPYETGPMDKEIINLTGKDHPNVLLIAHSQLLENQQFYFEVINNIYNGKYGCECRDLKSDRLTDKEYVQELVDWADIIYEGGGNTFDMIKLWKETGFDIVLRNAWESGKVMCGVSAGAMCWFKECSTDSLKIKFGEDQPLIYMKCLGFIDGFFVPHADESGRQENAKEMLKETNQIGILISNCCALEIVDDKYRLITSDGSYHNIEPFGLKTYWNNGEYIVEQIDKSEEFKSLDDLLSKN